MTIRTIAQIEKLLKDDITTLKNLIEESEYDPRALQAILEKIESYSTENNDDPIARRKISLAILRIAIILPLLTISRYHQEPTRLLQHLLDHDPSLAQPNDDEPFLLDSAFDMTRFRMIQILCQTKDPKDVSFKSGDTSFANIFYLLPLVHFGSNNSIAIERAALLALQTSLPINAIDAIIKKVNSLEYLRGTGSRDMNQQLLENWKQVPPLVEKLGNPARMLALCAPEAMRETKQKSPVVMFYFKDGDQNGLRRIRDTLYAPLKPYTGHLESKANPIIVGRNHLCHLKGYYAWVIEGLNTRKALPDITEEERLETDTLIENAETELALLTTFEAQVEVPAPQRENTPAPAIMR